MIASDTLRTFSYNVKSIPRDFLLRDYIEERAMGILNDIIENNATAWQTAKVFWGVKYGTCGWAKWNGLRG